MTESLGISMKESSNEQTNATQTDWHLLLGMVQEAVLTPVQIEVATEVLANLKPIKIDLVLLRRRGSFWTMEQLARLPDGIRQSRASHILCEFKYTQSVNQAALAQALMYDALYRTARKLRRGKVATFVLSARTPQPEVLQAFAYSETQWSGVYQSQQLLLKPITLLVLNKLSNEPHNAFVKCFASQHKAREAAFELLEETGAVYWSRELNEILIGLRSVFQQQEGDPMKELVITPEYVKQLGREVQRMVLAALSPEERLEGLDPEIVLSHYAPEERLEGLDPEIVLSHYAPKERLEGLDSEQRLAGLTIEERLAGLAPEEIEAYLRQRQQAIKPSSHSQKSASHRRRNS